MKKSFYQILKDLQKDPLANQTVSRMVSLPVRKDALVTLHQANNKDAETIARAIRHCPALASMVIGVINSPAYRPSHEVFCVEDAVDVLEPHRVRALAMSYGAQMMAHSTHLSNEILDEFWQISYERAAAARQFCDIVAPMWSEEAFDFALIQDIGLPALMNYDPVFYDELIQEGAMTNKVMTQLEREHFGFAHAMAGVIYLGRWQAGPQVLEPIRRQHEKLDPQQKVSELDDPIEVMRVACQFAGMLPHYHGQRGDTELMDEFFETNLSEDFQNIDEFIDFIGDQSEASMVELGTPDIPDDRAMLARLLRGSMGTTNFMAASYMRIDAREDEERKQLSDDIHDLRSKAFTDQLTGVLNRYGFTHLAKRRLQDASQSRLGACCIMVDMDDFKPINDEHGHAAGDQMIRGLSILMKRCIRRGDLLARLGGDEFAALVTGIDSERAFQLSQLLSGKLQGKQVKIAQDLEVKIHASIGVVYLPDITEDIDIEMVLAAADEAMYRRKRSGKHGVYFAEVNADRFEHFEEDDPGNKSILPPMS